jgi:hypothetical protein
MPKLHAHGVELVVDLLDAADHIETMTQDEIRDLLREAADVLGDLLQRDKPEGMSPAEPAAGHLGEGPQLSRATRDTHTLR